MNKFSSIALVTFLLWSLLFVRQSSAQTSGEDIEIVWGVPNVYGGYERVGVYENPGKGFVQITRSGDVFKFIRISAEMVYAENKKDTLVKTKTMTDERMVELDGRVYITLSDYDKTLNQEKLLAKEIDLDNLCFGEGAKELFKVDGRIVNNSSSQFGMYGKHNFLVSDDGERVLAVARYVPEHRENERNYDKMIFHLFDSKWNLVWDAKITMPRTESEITIMNYLVLDDNLYMFALTRSGKQLHPDTKVPIYDGASLFKIGPGGNMREKNLPFGNVVLTDITMKATNDGNIFFTSYYKAEIKGRSLGYVTAVFDVEGFELNEPRLHEFSDDLVKNYSTGMTHASKLIDGPGIPGLNVREAIPRADGGWYILGESGHLFYIGNYLHLIRWDFVVSAVDDNGNELFTMLLPQNKQMRSIEICANSFAHTYKNNLYVFYLDNTQNKNLKEGERPVECNWYYPSTLICVEIQPDGTTRRFPVFDAKDAAQVILPGDMEMIAPGVFLSGGTKSLQAKGMLSLVRIK